jgi:hypothetical protein
MPDPYVPTPDEAVGGAPILLTPSTFARHSRAVEMVEGDNTARYPYPSRGRTTHPSGGAWGFLASGHTISGASGLSLGSGTVALCDRSGTSLTATSETVLVLNSGGAITGPKALELDWTDGDWAVCECGGGPPLPISCGSCCVNLFPITVTDDNQTFTIDPITGFGGYTLTRPGVASVVVVSEGAACECTFGDATFTVGYQVECRDNSGLGPVQLAVSRKWHVISVHPDSLNTASCDLTDTSPFYADDSVSLAACCLSPGNPQVGSSVLVKDVDHCKDLSWSGTLTGVSPLDPAPGAVTITSTPTPSACGSATVKGCSGPSLTNLLPGATVVVKDASGSTLVSGTTNSSGFYAIVVSGYPSTVTVSHDRFVTQVGTIPANQCCADFVFDLSLNVADGYHCLVSTDCLLPVANVLHATHPLFGAITLTYSSSGFLGVGWYTPNIPYAYPGCSGCAAGTVTALCYMLVDEGILHDYWHAGSSDHCPDDTGDEVASTWTLESISCPPSFSMSFSLSPHAGIEQKFFCTTSPQAVTLTE